MDKIRIYIALLFCLTLSFIPPVLAQDTSGSNRYNTQYSYDCMGNITSLSRSGLLDDWSGAYCFYVKDHLGNNRMVVHPSGTVEQVNNYYPYGGLMANSTNHNQQRYKYNGKELDRMHGLDWYDYGARWMDAAIGRWHVMDPLCEKYYDVSPYVYCNGNPINQFDPDGRAIETVWDIGNVVYDVGAAIYNHVKGDHETAKSHWVDAGSDAIAMIIPFVPAGTTKIVKGAKVVRHGDKALVVSKGIDKATGANQAKVLLNNGRLGRQSRLRELGNDTKLGKADRGWIKQERNQIERGKRSTIRNPKGKVLAHPRGKEAAKGYSYKNSKLQLESNHKLQHKYDNNGRKNIPQ